MILQKFISQSGHCSRRKAEQLIREKMVTVNDKLAELGMKINENDGVYIGKTKIQPLAEKIYIILNKPAGYTCTNRKFKGEKNIFELVPAYPSLHAVGRLDKNSRGLLLLTNDGELTQKLTHPKYEHEKKYKVKIKEAKININLIINNMKSGIDIGDGDGTVKVKNIMYIKNNTFLIILTEGKKRQIRRMFTVLGYKIEDLVRIAMGKLELKNLPEGKYKHISLKNIY
ncbi:hypothetical protein A2331_02525 [Candidatus Falkowbacteria bacterium RIFOXYB2_FULL_34_18]|uniref:Pseudouridine synthase n=1 Tax=Candidatus Falkowbacteria bacterium RIFOXYD2_FULL_34_120 TaxID=1798007 RepID=A0A1F5TRP1_9BACT|nr:MAG: hypothetical protein A2331_02525 [Candidatus Falkowbacteria bacterium RIFOXYB2_FULL_34_18]OGF29506.1 MAG: hypothetical protein A2500_04375 [Candidatus Falkowbacteria bacterium RIFOXYC12_FULL_34_55]OGF36323.1 MAG: hypothetical protein A2466_05385 [Candidatus Falkowbacteria bacterium RIFOXYC2_FULL_34_220]OGF39032.1 MAG: hypothetical protein A2515_06840 [Candidatus Falkowbacteria bacterium RIFOXYD12_FULL_34_57]OGF41251.1 MAG: hypothetical protein A2531_01080 [Candidatus Falkowbacteria bact